MGLNKNEPKLDISILKGPFNIQSDLLVITRTQTTLGDFCLILTALRSRKNKMNLTMGTNSFKDSK